MFGAGRLIGIAAVALAGCGQAEATHENASAPQTFAGALSGTDAVVALVQSGPDWLAYVCGGPTTQVALTGWFQGRAEGESAAMSLTSDRNAAVVATRGAGSITGTLEDGSATYAFEAGSIETASGQVAGLFGALDSGCRTGLVVVPATAGNPSRMQGVWCDATGRVGQVTPITPLERDPRGVAVQVGQDARLLYLQPAVPPLH